MPTNTGSPAGVPGWPRATAIYEAPRSIYTKQARDRLGRFTKPGRKMPLPFINADAPHDWLNFGDMQSTACYAARLCVVCGLKLEGAVVLGRFGNADRLTNGPGGHPRCLHMAVNVCPHFNPSNPRVARRARVGGFEEPGREDRIVAYLVRSERSLGWIPEWDHGGLVDGPYATFGNRVEFGAEELTRPELRLLALADPLGLAAARLGLAPIGTLGWPA